MATRKKADPKPAKPAESRPSCATCAYWIRDERHSAMDATDGDCRRYPPQMMFSESEGPFSLWPLVEDSDVCGEYRGRLNA